MSPLAAIKTQLFASLVEESLADQTYDASLAGLDFSVGSDQDGIQIRVGGYSQKLPALLEVVLQKLRNLESDTTTFSSMHDRVRSQLRCYIYPLITDRLTQTQQLCRAYANASLNNPSQIGDTVLRHLTRETHWTYQERLDALQGMFWLPALDLNAEPCTTAGLTLRDVLDHAVLLLGELSVVALVHGNVTKEARTLSLLIQGSRLILLDCRVLWL